MKLTTVQRRVLLEQEEEQATWIVQQISKWMESKVQELIAPTLIQLLNAGDRNLVRWLTTESNESLQALGKSVADMLVKKGYQAVTSGKVAATTPMESVVNETADAMLRTVMQKMGTGKVYQWLVGAVGKYVSTYIRKGSVHDSISKHSKELASYDVPDAVSQMLGPRGAENVIKTLAYLRKNPELYQTIWKMVQGMGSMRRSSVAASTAAQRQTRATRKGVAAPRTA